MIRHGGGCSGNKLAGYTLDRGFATCPVLIDILRELLGFVLPPANFLVLGVLVVCYALRYRRRWPLVIGLFLAWVMMTPWLGMVMVHGLEYAISRPKHLKGDVLVVLGEGSVANTPQSRGSGSLSGSMANEFLTAVRLERMTHLPILVSGGKGSFGDGNEALIGRSVLRGLGIDHVYVDAKSQTTYQNAADSARILRAHHWHRPILVVSAFHMLQAREDFRYEGIHVIPYPTGYQTPKTLRWSPVDLLPSTSGLDMTAEALQEYLSIAVYRLGIKR